MGLKFLYDCSKYSSTSIVNAFSATLIGWQCRGCWDVLSSFDKEDLLIDFIILFHLYRVRAEWRLGFCAMKLLMISKWSLKCRLMTGKDINCSDGSERWKRFMAQILALCNDSKWWEWNGWRVSKNNVNLRSWIFKVMVALPNTSMTWEVCLKKAEYYDRSVS